MMIRLCFLHKEEWRCPSQIQSWPLCFPGPPKESDCTGDIFLLPKAWVWMIGSWGRRPIAGNHRRSACSSIQIKLRWALFVTYTIIQSIMWNVFSAFNPSKWSSGQPTSSWGFGALLKGLTSVSSPTLYPLGHDCPVPFFPEVHEEVTRSRKAPRCFNGQGHRPARHGPPSGPPGQAIKQLHKGGADPGVLQELLTATDLALRVTKVKAWSLGQTMSTLVVQERHLWLTLADMREAGKHPFLDSHISQAGLFGEAVESFAQQFSNAQKQMEAFHHILSWWSAAVSTPPQSLRLLSSPRVPSCCLHLRSSWASAAAFTPAKAWSWWQERGEARLHPFQASGVPFVSFLFCFAAGSPASGTQKLKK